MTASVFCAYTGLPVLRLVWISSSCSVPNSDRMLAFCVHAGFLGASTLQGQGMLPAATLCSFATMQHPPRTAHISQGPSALQLSRKPRMAAVQPHAGYGLEAHFVARVCRLIWAYGMPVSVLKACISFPTSSSTLHKSGVRVLGCHKLATHCAHCIVGDDAQSPRSALLQHQYHSTHTQSRYVAANSLSC